MVTLVVATTVDLASIGLASALLSMPSWHPGPALQDMSSFVNKEVRLLKHEKSIVKEDHLDRRWEEATCEVVDEVIFLSKHTAVSNRPVLTIHPIGVPHLQEGDVPLAGGRPGWAALPNPRIGPWLRLLKTIAQSHNLTPEFEITLGATHHGPETQAPTMFVEIGSTEEYWKRQDAAQAILVWEGLGLGGGTAVGDWSRKDGVWVGHLLSRYSLPMEDPNQLKSHNGVGGTWKKAIKVSFETTKQAFPGGQVFAHLDHKNFKSWQKSAITGFVANEGIQIGKPADFC